MNKKFASTISALFLLCIGSILGALSTDYARVFGVTHQRYVITFSEDQTPQNIWKCSVRGTLYGENRSIWNPGLGHQEHCIIEAEAETLPDGGLAVYPTAATWNIRLSGHRRPTTFTSSEIKGISPAPHSFRELL